MKPIQIILIAVALVAALGAGFLMLNLNGRQQVVVENGVVEPAFEVKKVLVANEEIPMGTALSEENLSWEDWPETGLRDAFILEEDRPEAVEEFAKAIARASFFPGEPIREEKIVRSDSGYLSAILPAGKRAVAITVSASTSAGGFILPNDHVDVVMSYRKRDGNREEWITETILQNIRVLAIDQVIEEQDGEKAKVGDTATLEMTAEQVEIVSAAKSIAKNRLMLALRSVEDSELESTDAGSHLISSNTRKSRGSVRIIRYGKSTEERPKK